MCNSSHISENARYHREFLGICGHSFTVSQTMRFSLYFPHLSHTLYININMYNNRQKKESHLQELNKTCQINFDDIFCK